MKKMMVLMGCLLPWMVWSQQVDTAKTFVIRVPLVQIRPMPLDTSIYVVNVVGFLEGRMGRDVPAPITVVNKDVFRNGDQTSLIGAMNSVPGVLMESRGAGGSHRISIRGSALRAPFAVRNVKMYVNGIPFTSPDGQSPLEVMDAADLEFIEVLKGPSGSIWGSGNGGVIQFSAVSPRAGTTERMSIRSEGQAGSFGQYRMHHAVQVLNPKGGIRFSQTNQSVDGYRQQEFNRKSSSFLTIRHSINSRHVLNVLGLFYNGNWGLPCGQTAAQRDEDRTLAIPYSVENNASVWRNRAMGGLSHTYYGENKVIWRTSINGYGTEKTNPYGTSAFRNGFKTESAAGGGMRTDWTKRFSNAYQSTRLTVGGETQLEHYFIEETKNNFGQPGDFKYMYNVNYANVNVFALADVNVRERWKFQVGTSVMREQQHVSGYTADDWATDTTSVSEWQVLPRVAVSYYLTPRMQWYGSLGVGNSMPNVFEMIDYENNRYNLDLQPEHGLNRELGLKWGDPVREMSFEVNYYYTNIRRIILSETALVADPGNPNAQIEVDQFANKGTTAQQGIEVSGAWARYFDDKRLHLQLQTAGSWNHYRFVDFESAAVNYAGRRVPGVPDVQWFNHVKLTYRRHYSVGTMIQYMGPIDLTYSNEVRSTDYTLVNVYASAERTFGKHWTLGVRAGINNATDVKYSGFFNYNDAANRYYNPALPINYFGALSVQFKGF